MTRYFPIAKVAQQLGFSNLTVNRLCGTVNFNPGGVDLGLGFKFTGKELEVISYARRVLVGAEVGSNAPDTFTFTHVRSLRVSYVRLAHKIV